MNCGNQYTLSVIIPNYNKSAYLNECVCSVLQQTLLPNEIIVVDDCSTDTSREIIEELAKKNGLLSAIYLDVNGGVSHARNIGLRAAQSRYVTFLDSDDFYINPEKLQNEMNLIRENEESTIVYSKVAVVEANGKIIAKPVQNQYYLVGNVFQKLLTGKFQWPAIARDFCVKKSALEKLGGYNENRNLYEDLELLIKLAKDNSFLCTYELGSAYRQVEGGLSKRTKEEHDKERKKIFFETIHSFPVYIKMYYILQWESVRFYNYIQQKYWWNIKKWLKKF